jgi:hypothetical protein
MRDLLDERTSWSRMRAMLAASASLTGAPLLVSEPGVRERERERDVPPTEVGDGRGHGEDDLDVGRTSGRGVELLKATTPTTGRSSCPTLTPR